MAQIGRHIVDDFSLRVTDDVYRVNTPYAAYGIGVSLATVPLYVIQKAFGAHGPGEQFWVLLLNPILLATTAVVLFRIGLALGWSRRRSLALGLGFGILTMAPWHSTELFSEPGVTLGLCLALLGLIRFRAAQRHGPWLLGGGLALAVFWKKGRAIPVITGMFVSLAVMSAVELLQKLKATREIWLQNVGTEIFWPWYALIGVVLTVGVAWVTKLLLPRVQETT